MLLTIPFCPVGSKSFEQHIVNSLFQHRCVPLFTASSWPHPGEFMKAENSSFVWLHQVRTSLFWKQNKFSSQFLGRSPSDTELPGRYLSGSSHLLQLKRILLQFKQKCFTIVHCQKIKKKPKQNPKTWVWTFLEKGFFHSYILIVSQAESLWKGCYIHYW